MTASITDLLNSLRRGNESAAEKLVQHYLPLLRKRLAELSGPLRISDEDDIAIGAFFELCTALEKSRFEDISDRTQLWQVLSMLAVRKANDFRKFERAQKRGGDSKVLSFDNLKQQVASLDERPELHLEMLELYEAFLKSLPDDELRKVAELKMSGLTNAEISSKLDVAIRTIQLMVARLKEKMIESFNF